MQTHFTPAQLADPDLAEANTILRACVHCGFCTATCPTYVLLGDELDSPRGRIYLMKDMLEGNKPASPEVVKHIDRCLSCLSCMTTCPSGVHYMHLVDHARRHIEETYRRPFLDRSLRSLLVTLMPHPGRFRVAMVGASLARLALAILPVGGLLPRRVRAMLDLVPRSLPGPSRVDLPQVFPAEGARRKRVALLSGCVQQVVAPRINEATVRLLTRHGVEVVVPPDIGCCGSLAHHLGREEPALAAAKANIEAWLREADGEGLDAIVVNASGCGTTMKDYGFMLRSDPDWADRAARVSALSKDVTEILAELELKPTGAGATMAVAYHSACSMQHGQKLTQQPKSLLKAAGFAVRDVPEGHLCCGSAGTYNMLQPEIAARLRDRKLGNIGRTGAVIVATGNIGCMTQLERGPVPILHTVELLDWATGGPLPEPLEGRVPEGGIVAA